MIHRFYMIAIVLFEVTKCSPLDDGKYNPRKYGHDDGRYYRPLTEGKYIPGDEGRYTYIYRQGLYPTDTGDYRYIHQVGPDGPNGGGDGSYGPDGADGYPWNEYIGHRIYADQYPYLFEVIEALIDKFVSKSYSYYCDESASSEVFYKTKAPNDVTKEEATKCEYIETDKQALTDAMFNETEWNQDLGSGMSFDNEDPYKTFYNFKGIRVREFTSNNTMIKKRLKLLYNVSVRLIEETIVVDS